MGQALDILHFRKHTALARRVRESRSENNAKHRQKAASAMANASLASVAHC